MLKGITKENVHAQEKRKQDSIQKHFCSAGTETVYVCVRECMCVTCGCEKQQRVKPLCLLHKCISMGTRFALFFIQPHCVDVCFKNIRKKKEKKPQFTSSIHPNFKFDPVMNIECIINLEF